MTQRRVLIITNVLPPALVGGTPRLLRWCETLPPRGWQVSLAGFCSIPWLEEGLDPAPVNVPVWGVPFDSRIARLVRKFTARRANSEGWPDAFRPKMSHLLGAVRKAVATEHPDILMVTVPSFSLLDAAFLENLQEIAPGRVVVERRDPFVDNVSLITTTQDSERAREMERSAAPFINGGAEVNDVYVEQMQGWLCGASVVHVPNGFSRARYSGLDRREPWPGKRDGVMRLVYVGMAHGAYAPAQLIPAIRIAFERCPELARILRFHFVGKFQADAMGDWSTLPGVLEAESQVPYSRIPQLLVHSDVVTMVLGKQDQKIAFPGAKVLEYLGADRPILAVTTGPAARVVEQTKTGLTADPSSPESIAQAILTLYDCWKTNAPFPMGAPALREPWEAGNIADTLVGLFNTVLKRVASR